MGWESWGGGGGLKVTIKRVDNKPFFHFVFSKFQNHESGSPRYTTLWLSFPEDGEVGCGLGGGLGTDVFVLPRPRSCPGPTPSLPFAES